MEEDLLKLIFFPFFKINYQIEGHQLGEGWTILLSINTYTRIMTSVSIFPVVWTRVCVCMIVCVCINMCVCVWMHVYMCVLSVCVNSIHVSICVNSIHNTNVEMRTDTMSC